MGRAKKHRIDVIFREFIQKPGLRKKLDDLCVAFESFGKQVLSIADFENWLKKLRNRSRNFNNKKENDFLDIFELIDQQLANEEGLFANGLSNRLIEYFLFEGLPSQFKTFGVYHYINDDVQDDGYYAKLEFHVDPGVNQKEFTTYVKKIWPRWENTWRKLTWPDDRFLRRVRVKDNDVRDQKIIELRRKEFTDKEINDKLHLGGKLSLIRQVISRAKKKKLL